MVKKKVTYVITKSNWGGAQRYVFDLATHLPKEEFEVAVALGGTGTQGAKTGLLASKLQESGVRTIFIQSFMRDISLLAEWRAFKELLQICKTEKPDVVHLNSSKAGGTGALAARMAGVKTIIFTAHGWPFLERRNILWRAVIYILSWLTALLSTKVIVVSDYDLHTAKAMPFVGSKVVRIYNGVEQVPLADGGVIRKAFLPNVKIKGTVGELTKNKNQIALLEQAQANPDMYVAIVGEGEDRPMLEAKIKEFKLEDRVKLFGFMPAAEVLKGFDTFALPSLKEGLPYVLLEAKAAGLPIEASPVGGIPEILSGNIEDFSLEKIVRETENLYKN